MLSGKCELAAILSGVAGMGNVELSTGSQPSLSKLYFRFGYNIWGRLICRHMNVYW